MQDPRSRNKISPAVHEQEACHKLLHGHTRLFAVLPHVLADDVTDRRALVILEVEAPGARVAGGLLHLLLAQGGLLHCVLFQVCEEPLLDLRQLANCAVVENQGADRFAVHRFVVVSLNVFHHVQLSLGAETTNLAGVACPCVEEIHVDLG